MVHADGQMTERHDEANRRFSLHCERTKNEFNRRISSLNLEYDMDQCLGEVGADHYVHTARTMCSLSLYLLPSPKRHFA